MLPLSISSNLFSLNLSSSSLRLHPITPVTSIHLFIVSSITCFRMHSLRMVRSVQVAFLLFTAYRTIFSCLIIRNTFYISDTIGATDVSISLQHHISKLSTYSISFSEVSKFQHNKKLCSKFGTLPVLPQI
jgi:hypothetical protein